MPLESQKLFADDDDDLFAARLRPSKRPDYVSDRFGRELEVIFGGSVDAVVQAKNRLPELGSEAIMSAAVGFGVRAAEAKLPWMRPALTIGMAALTVSTVKDLIVPAQKIAESLVDAWKSDDNLEASRAKFAQSGGKFATDLAVSSAFGLAGSGLANRVLFGPESNFIRIATFEAGKTSPNPRMTLYNREHPDARNFIIGSESTVKITTSTVRGKPHNYNATAFIASEDGLLVTNQHVVKDKVEFSAIRADGKKYKAELVSEDKVNDLAVLKIGDAAATFKPLPVSKTEANVGDHVVPVSYFHNVTRPTMGPGKITSAENLTLVAGSKNYYNRPAPDVNIEAENIRRAIFGTFYSRPGASGSPLLNSNGEVAGVIQGEIRHKNYAVTAGAINKILLEARAALAAK